MTALTGRPHLPTGTRSAGTARWDSFAREVASATEPRLVVSSEYFAAATPSAIERAVRDLGGPGSVRVVATLRPLAKILPSRWQQNVQSGHVIGFEDWLHRLFNSDGPAAATRPNAFWYLHHHDELVRRWADVVGAEQVTVIVLDDTRRDQVLRTFEGMLGLRDGTLSNPAGPSNRSLTLDETEAIRAFNVEARSRAIPEDVVRSVMLQGAAPFLKELEPASGSMHVELPRWVLSDVLTVSRRIADGIGGSGVRVLGDLDALTWIPSGRHGSIETSPKVEAKVAALVTVGALIGTGVVSEDSRMPREDAMPAVSEAARTHTPVDRDRIGSERQTLGRRRARILAKALARVTRERIAQRLEAGASRGGRALPGLLARARGRPDPPTLP